MSPQSPPPVTPSRQHLNLMHAGLLPRTTPFGAKHAVLACLGAMLAVFAGALGVSALAHRLSQQAQRMDTEVQQLRQQSPEASAADALDTMRQAIARLDAQVHGQQQVLDSLKSRQPDGGAQANPLGYLDALARQAEPKVWITGFSLSAPHLALQLKGRTVDPQALPAYVRRLGQEPLFQGRDLTDIKLEAVPPKDDGSGGYTEFALQATPSARPGRQP